jgi:hypothetical protein
LAADHSRALLVASNFFQQVVEGLITGFTFECAYLCLHIRFAILFLQPQVVPVRTPVVDLFIAALPQCCGLTTYPQLYPFSFLLQTVLASWLHFLLVLVMVLGVHHPASTEGC